MKRAQKRLWWELSSRLSRAGLTLRQWASGTVDDDAEKSQKDALYAKDLYRAASSLRGGVAKMAQLRAYLQGANPLEANAQNILGLLWDRAPSESPALIRQVIEQELQQKPEDLFQSFQDEPLASASLGQVHSAQSRDGRALAIKVQYPGIAESLDDDLQSNRILRELVGADLGNTLSDETLDALRKQLLEEIDYRKEADSIRLFRDFFAHDPDIVVPNVYAEWSSQKVLAMELLTGERLPSFLRSGTEAERSSVAQTILRFALECPLRHGHVNIDPNPGNYLILDRYQKQTRVGFLDFGSVAKIPDELQEADRNLYWAMIKRDGESLRYAVYQQGLVSDVSSFDLATYRRWERLFCAPFLEREATRLTPEYAKELGELTWILVEQGKLSLPATTLLLWRQRLGVLSILSALRPVLSFRAILAQILRDNHPIPILERYP
ncbi:MAG TPA: AarF/ABC1/UbiB kinase family protein [Pseudomonadota bacterium]|nr:AarF/ABC1/UbiB kinase family protein [Pseudomonadota bacterium]